jgi:DeoR family glycerol-3-phosphate regulon repressor
MVVSTADTTDYSPHRDCPDEAPMKREASLKERRRKILELVRAQGFASIEDLANRFALTPQTIRRDINRMSEDGLLHRHHGGAAVHSSVQNMAYSTRQILFPEEKRRIARHVAQHIPDRTSLFINIGTTTEEVAKALSNHSGLSVITNNLNVAVIMSGSEDCEVLVAGGKVRNVDRGITGEASIDFIRQFKVDFGIIGISGIDTDGSLLDFDYREVRAARAIMENSRTTFLAADHSKFGRSPMIRLGHIREVDALFTDAPPPPPQDKILASSDVQVNVASR